MKILKFNESKDDFFSLIKDYFSSFEEIEDICNIEFTKVSNNFFKIKIYLTSSLLLKIDDEEKLIKLDQEIKNKKDDVRILMELKRSMQMLIDEDVVEQFYIEGSSLNYQIEIYTKGTSTEWISVNNWEIKYDRNILKKILLDKFKVNLLNIEIEEGDEVRFIIEIEPITKRKAEDVFDFIIKTTLIDTQGDNIDVFERGNYNRFNPTISFIYFDINNLLSI
jgi:hypothetical protein